MHGDEVSIGYNAFSFLKTGNDQNGNFLPLASDQFGDFRPAGYHYLDVPFVALFGLNEFSVRLPSALAGSLSIILIYLLVHELFANKKMALLAGGLLAITPWDINISRATSEGVIATFLVMLGIYLFIKAVKSKTKAYPVFIASVVAFLLSFFFYHAARYFVVLFFPVLLATTYVTAKKKILVAAACFAVILAGLAFFLFAGHGTGRVSEVGLFSIPGGTVHLKQAMDEEGTLNPLINRFYNNKLFYFGRFFITFYSQHLSGDFLFVNNGFPIRYRMHFTGNLYLVTAPFLLLGLAFLLTEGIKSKKYIYLLPVAWLFIAPIPAGLTWEDLPNVQRAGIMIPALTIITAFGFMEVVSLLKGRLRAVVVIICVLFLTQAFLNFYHNYFWRLRIHEPWHRSAAQKELVLNVEGLSKKYPVTMTAQNGNTFTSYLFYTKFDPKTYQKMGSPREKDGLMFNNLTYYNADCPLTADGDTIYSTERDMIFVNKPGCSLPKNAEEITVIRTPDGIPAFNIVKLNKN